MERPPVPFKDLKKDDVGGGTKALKRPELEKPGEEQSTAKPDPSKNPFVMGQSTSVGTKEGAKDDAKSSSKPSAEKPDEKQSEGTTKQPGVPAPGLNTSQQNPQDPFKQNPTAAKAASSAVQPKPDKETKSGDVVNDPYAVVAIESPLRRSSEKPATAEEKKAREEQAQAQISRWSPALQKKVAEKLAAQKKQDQPKPDKKNSDRHFERSYLGRINTPPYIDRQDVQPYTRDFDRMREGYGFDPRLNEKGSPEEQSFQKAREDYWRNPENRAKVKEQMASKYLAGTMQNPKAWEAALKEAGFKEHKIAEIMAPPMAQRPPNKDDVPTLLGSKQLSPEAWALQVRKESLSRALGGYNSGSPETREKMNAITQKIIERSYNPDKLAKELAADELSGIRQAEKAMLTAHAKQAAPSANISGIPPLKQPDTKALEKDWAALSDKDRQQLFQQSQQEVARDQDFDKNLFTNLTQVNARTNKDHIHGREYAPGNPEDRSGYAASRDMLDTISQRYGFDPRFHPPGSPEEKRFLAERRAYEESRTDFLKMLQPGQRQPYIDRTLQMTLGQVRRLDETFSRQQLAYKDAGWLPDSKLPYVSSEGFVAELNQRGVKNVSDRDLHLGLQTVDALKERFPKDRPSAEEQIRRGDSSLYYSQKEMEQQEYDKLIEQRSKGGQSLSDYDRWCMKKMAGYNTQQQLENGTPESWLKKPLDELSAEDQNNFLQDNFRFGVEKMEKQVRTEMVQRMQNHYHAADQHLFDALNRQGFIGAAGDKINSYGSQGGWVLNSDYSTPGLNGKLNDLHAYVNKDMESLKNFKGSAEDFQKELQAKTKTLSQKMNAFDKDIQEFLKSQNRWEDGVSTFAAASAAMAATAICPPAGPATFMAAMALGAGIGATTKVGVKGLDALSAGRPYTSEEFQKDATIGSIAGGTTVLGNVASKYLTSALLSRALTTQASQTLAGRLLAQGLEDSLDGVISNGTATFAEGAMEGKSLDENMRDSLNSAALGAVLTPITAPVSRAVADPLTSRANSIDISSRPDVDIPGLQKDLRISQDLASSPRASVEEMKAGKPDLSETVIEAPREPRTGNAGDPNVRGAAPVSGKVDSSAPKAEAPQAKAAEPSTAKVDTPNAKAPEGAAATSKYSEIASAKNLTPEARQRAELLRNHLEQGFELMRAGKFAEASQHFHNPDVASKAGFNLDLYPNHFSPSKLTDKAVDQALEMIGSRSWYNIDGKRIAPSSGSLPPNYNPATATPAEKALAQRFEKEVAMIQAEEWTHAYQDLMGGNVSKQGQLLPKHTDIKGADDHELDVGQFFKEQGLEPSNQFLGRYGRASAMQNLESKLSPQAAEQITQGLGKMKPGEKQIIGREGDVKLDPTLRAVSRQHAQVEALENGNYRISDGVPGKPSVRGTYVEDANGMWQRVTDPVELAPGQRVRMGRDYEFSLPKPKSADTPAGDVPRSSVGDTPGAANYYRNSGQDSTKTFELMRGGKPRLDALGQFGIDAADAKNFDFKLLGPGADAYTKKTPNGRIEVGLPGEGNGQVRLNELAHELNHGKLHLDAQRGVPGAQAKLDALEKTNTDYQQARTEAAKYTKNGQPIPPAVQQRLDETQYKYNNNEAEFEGRIAGDQALSNHYLEGNDFDRANIYQNRANQSRERASLIKRLESGPASHEFNKLPYSQRETFADLYQKAAKSGSDPKALQEVIDGAGEFKGSLGKALQAEGYPVGKLSADPTARPVTEYELTPDKMKTMEMFHEAPGDAQIKPIMDILNKPEYKDTRRALEQWSEARAKGSRQGFDQYGKFTNKLAGEIAESLGYTEVANLSGKGGATVFVDQEGRFLTPDIDSHSGLGWKVHPVIKGKPNLSEYDTADILGNVHRDNYSRKN